MVDVVAYHWKQVPQTALNISNALSVFGQPASKFPKTLRLELLVVHDDGPTLTQSFTERRDEGRAGIIVIHCEKFEMVGGGSGLLLNVHGELKWNVIIGMHSHETRDRRIYGFKIHEVERVFERFKLR